MKKIKRILSLLLTLVLCLSLLPTFALADGPAEVDDWAALQQALTDGETNIKLTDDTSSSGPLTIGDGKHRLSSNISVPLRAICVLERAAENAIRRIDFSEAYPMLLQQVYRPADIAAMHKTLSLIDRLDASVSLWRLGCNMDIEAAKISYETMKGDKHEA